MDFNLALMIAVPIVGLIAGLAIRRFTNKLTPTQKYVKMANKARKYDRKNWDDFEKQMLKKLRESQKKGLTNVVW